jgi:hypothetical protein
MNVGLAMLWYYREPAHSIEQQPIEQQPIEQQRAGWLAILNNFARHVEAKRPV